MVAHIRTWTTSYNNVPADETTLNLQAKNIIFALKNHIIAAGYTVYQSNDGVGNFGTAGDAVDRWATSANLIWAAAGVNHSWIVLERATGQLPNSKKTRICIDLSTGATNQHQVSFNTASTAFTLAAGTATAAPTSIVANTSLATARQFIRSTAAPDAVASKFHMGRSNAGDWFFIVSVNGTARNVFVAGSFISAGYETGTNYPCWDVRAYLDGVQGGLSVSNFAGSTHCMFAENDTLQAGLFGVCTLVCGGTNPMTTFTASGSTTSGQQPLVPVAIGSFTVPTIAFKGALVDVYLAPTGAAMQGDEAFEAADDPGTGPTNFAIVGDFYLPNGGVAPQL